MTMLYNNQGVCCGNFNGTTAPAGFWLRPDDLPDTLSPHQILQRLGAARFATIWNAALANPTIAFGLFKQLTAREIDIADSFPLLRSMEQAGHLPAGTAVEIWS